MPVTFIRSLTKDWGMLRRFRVLVARLAKVAICGSGEGICIGKLGEGVTAGVEGVCIGKLGVGVTAGVGMLFWEIGL